MTFYILSTEKKTGGSYLLHQLADELDFLGHDVFVSYPLGGRVESSIFFDLNVSEAKDSIDSVVIVPEIFSSLVSRFPSSKIYFWWLSVDNFFRARHDSLIKDFLRRYLSLILGKRQPLSRLSRCHHLVQSNYAKTFLKSRGFESESLSDFLNPDFLSLSPAPDKRNPVILYNPSKGIDTTQLLIRSFTAYDFKPIQGLSPEQMISLMSSSMIYIDFGHHPGKDRMPREAAMCGCCIITGLLGSAGNETDIPISKKYKLDSNASIFISEFEKLVHSIFSDFHSHFHDFDTYRDLIRSEPLLFKKQVLEIFHD